MVKDREHHERLFKASMNPIRRKIIATIGLKGKTREDLKKELDLTDFQLKFNIDWLIKEGFVKEENGELILTEEGLELLK
ncbi:MAG: hypothetical protein NZ895_01055 [Archaeoglobaceae archaeon]|nr:hypothetical protein [Archaeoglobaceae archaeon]MCX8152005.1 hypothetical protein [Archaeoglobaceae archaeon]MDW8013394.1 hypothetical protein [Archaeoglobaceae archaeon]